MLSQKPVKLKDADEKERKQVDIGYVTFFPTGDSVNTPAQPKPETTKQ
jgi:hypothetical protein